MLLLLGHDTRIRFLIIIHDYTPSSYFQRLAAQSAFSVLPCVLAACFIAAVLTRLQRLRVSFVPQQYQLVLV